MDRSSASNPFATRFVRPDAATYLPLQTPSIAELADRFETLGRRAQIVGPHGVGKSTLLANLMRELTERGEDVRAIALHLGDRRLPAAFEQELPWSPRQVVVIDGAEQLSWLRRRGLMSRTAKRNSGLLVTTHTDLGLPALCELTPQVENAIAIARRLDPDEVIDEAAIRDAFERRRGDLRETLFDLFDLYRARTFDPDADDRTPQPATTKADQKPPPPAASGASDLPSSPVTDGRDDPADRNDSSGE